MAYGSGPMDLGSVLTFGVLLELCQRCEWPRIRCFSVRRHKFGPGLRG